MPAAALVFMDVVGYSAESIDFQFDTIMELNREVNYVLYRDLDPLAPKVIALPTGDGMLLALIDEPTPVSGLAEKCFDVVASVQLWSRKGGNAELRFGLHYGPISFIRDVNGKRNICGDAANTAARIMSLGQANHIVASADFVNWFIPQAAREMGRPISLGNQSITAIDEVDAIVRHQRRILGYTLVLELGGQLIGSTEPLDIKYHADARFPAVEKAESREKTLARVLRAASRVTFLGLTYQHLSEILNLIGPQANEINLCIPDENAIREADRFFGPGLRWTPREDVLRIFQEWASARERTQTRVLVYHNVPPFGATLVESESSDRGFLHLSMYLKGILPENTPFTEVVWSRTARPSKLYEFYSHYIADMINGLDGLPL